VAADELRSGHKTDAGEYDNGGGHGSHGTHIRAFDSTATQTGPSPIGRETDHGTRRSAQDRSNRRRRGYVRRCRAQSE